MAAVQSPTGRRVGITAGVVALVGGITYGVNEMIGKPLRAGAKAAKDAFQKEYKAQQEAEAKEA